MVTRRFVGIAVLVAMAGGALFVSHAIAQEPSKPGELSRTLDAANLSPESKVIVRAKGVDAVRAAITQADVAGLIQRGVGRGIQPVEQVRLLGVVLPSKRPDPPVR